MKKFISFLLIAVLLFSVTACDKKETETKETEAGEEVSVTEAEKKEDTAEAEKKDEASEDKEAEDKEKAADAEVSFEQPVLLTSVGQSADVEMVKAMLKKLELDFKAVNLATPDDFGEAKTLILAVGGSSKGLGAAGIDANGELERIKDLLAAAKDKEIKIIALHIGGEARRGELSDKFIGPSFEAADYAIVVEGGDSDGMMAGLAKDNDITIDMISAISDTIASLEKLFK